MKCLTEEKNLNVYLTRAPVTEGLMSHLSLFEQFVAMATAHFGCKVGRLRSDRGGEYVSNSMKNFAILTA